MLWCPLGKLDFFSAKRTERCGGGPPLCKGQTSIITLYGNSLALLSISLPLANNGKWPKIDPQIVGISLKRSHLPTLHENETFLAIFKHCYPPILNEKQPQMETPSGRSLLHNLKVFLDSLRLLG